MTTQCLSWFGVRDITLTPGVIDGNARDAFSNGQCHALAIALHELTGWELVGLDWQDGLPNHVLVRSPDGGLLDVGGWEADERWNGGHYDVESITREQIEQEFVGEDVGYLPPDLDAGRAFAQAVLDAYGTPVLQ